MSNDLIVSSEWQLIETAPKDGTEFQVAWTGDWYPKCKIIDNKVYEWTEVHKNWESYMDWDLLHTDNIDVINNIWVSMFWMPTPTMPESYYV